MEIKIKCLNGTNDVKIIKKGEWIDLYAADTVKLEAPTQTVENIIEFDSYMINLGIAAELPSGYEAIVAPRSSTFKHFGIILANSIGIIDNSYCGNTDYWKFPAIALRQTTIHYGDKIAQFRIQLSQKATIWQKIKWLFSNKIELVQVDNLSKTNRGGIGSTGD